MGVDLIVGRGEIAFDEEPLVLGVEDGALSYSSPAKALTAASESQGVYIMSSVRSSTSRRSIQAPRLPVTRELADERREEALKVPAEFVPSAC